MIVVTGATGGLGSRVVEHLLRLVSPSRVVASVRAPEKAADLTARGVRVRRGDFDDSSSLDEAFAGAEAVLVISTRGSNAERFVQQTAAIDAARRAGARTVMYTSVLQRRGSPFAATPGHADTEDYLNQTDGSFTVVRNGHYIENLPMFLGSAVETGELALPPDGPTSWVARDDLGEAIARLLVTDFRGRRSLSLTGPCALDFADVAAIASEIVGRPIRRRIIPPSEYIGAMVARGVSPPMATMLATGFASRAAGELALVDATLATVVGRPARTVEEVLPGLLGKNR